MRPGNTAGTRDVPFYTGRSHGIEVLILGTILFLIVCVYVLIRTRSPSELQELDLLVLELQGVVTPCCSKLVLCKSSESFQPFETISQAAPHSQLFQIKTKLYGFFVFETQS